MKFFKIFFIFSSIIFQVNAEPSLSSGESLQVVRITPEGSNIPEAGQIVIEFSKPMAKLGANLNEKTIPVTITPEIAGQWQWINDKTLVLNVNNEKPLKKAEKYTLTIKPSLPSLDGSVLSKEITHTFTTTLPTMTWSNFRLWKSPTRPVIAASFNMPVTKESVEAHVFFAPKGDDKTHIKAQAISDEYDDKGDLKSNLTFASRWLIEPVQELTTEQPYEMRVEPGILSKEGSTGGIEKETPIKFKTFGSFKLVGFSCRTTAQLNDDKQPIFTPDNPQKDTARCDPMQQIELVFTSPVKRSTIKKKTTLSPDPTAGKTDVDIWGDWGDYVRLDDQDGPDASYRVALPRGLKAASDYTVTVGQPEKSAWTRFYQKILTWFSQSNNMDVVDEFGRTLENPTSFVIKLDDRKPNYVLANRTAILEQQADSDVPLYVNNLKSATLNYQSVTVSNVVDNQTMVYPLTEVKNIQYAIPLKIRDLLKGRSGVILGTLQTNPTIEKSRDEENITLFAQVTPYQLQIKVGYHNTIVWVTDLATSKVVRDAKVSFFLSTYEKMGHPQNVLTTGTTNEQGIAVLDGIEKIDPMLKHTNFWNWKDPKLFARVEKEDSIAMMPLTNDFEINMYRSSGEKFWAFADRKYGHIQGWGTTAQGIYRAGDTVQYKIYMRDQSNEHYVLPPTGKYVLEVKDPTGKTVHDVQNIKFNEFGAMDGEFHLAKNTPIGWYQFEVSAFMNDMANKQENADQKLQPTFRLTPMSVLVSEFTPSPFKVSVDANQEEFQPDQELKVTTSAKFHAGGAFTDANTEVAVLLQATSFISKNPVAEDFFFGNVEPQYNDQTILRKTGRLNGKGEFEISQKLTDQPIFYGKLLIEGKVNDDRGKSVAANKTVTYIGGDRLVGLKQKEWLLTANKPAEIEVVVVGKDGNPMAGNVKIAVEQKETSVAKVKSAGNAYKTHATHEWIEVTTADLKVSTTPTTYRFTPTQAGNYRITAKTTDSKEKTHVCVLESYVTGTDFIVWGDENDTYLPVIPEKNDYQVGDTAKFLVKNPFPKAQALITVERFGVIDHFVQTLDTSSPIIEIPVKADYLPNFFVNVSILSPRAGNPPLELGQIDLAKPAFRTGYAKVSVKNDYKKIDVTTKTDKDVYKPREKVTLSVHAEVKHPRDKGEPIELAVVVLDDSVFDLISLGKNYYNPYNGFYREESLDMRNYSLLNGLVGRMKFAKKGATPGGDGGVDLSMRNIFKFVSYWNPSLLVDTQGNATVEFDAPDNLTGWRVFVIAMTPTDRMGIGEGTFKVNRDTEIRPVMPNQIAEGDSFDAGFSIMNRTDKTRTLKVEITASGALKELKKGDSKQFDKTVTLEPLKRTTLYIPIHAGNVSNTDQGKIDFIIKAGDAIDEDKMSHTVPVNRVRILETKAVFGSLTSEAVTIPIVVPKDIYTDVGKLEVGLSPSMISNISGIFTYMKAYPYNCWEQKISKASVAAYYSDLKQYVGKDVDWPDTKALIKTTLEESSAFQAPNGGMAYFQAKDDYVDPFLSAFSALSFSWLKQAGYDAPTLVEDHLVQYIQGLLKNDFIEDYYMPAMVATTRAVILEALSYRDKITVDDLERFLPHVTKMNAFGKASFVRAALNVKGANTIADKVIRELLSHFNETSTQMTRAEDSTSSMLRILDTPLRETCSVLETLVRYEQTPNGQQLVGDKATKLVKTITSARKGKTHFENTQENLYCARALALYSKVYEKEQPNMTIVVNEQDKEIGKTHFNDLANPEVVMGISLPVTESKDVDLSISRNGSGRLYYTTRLMYAPKTDFLKPVNAGMEVRREYSRLQDGKWIKLSKNDQLKRGDLVRVDLYVIAPADRTFVVVNDPVPGCLEPVNKDLATASLMDQRQLDDTPAIGTWWHELKDIIDFNATRWAFSFKEMRHDSVRFYADYLPKGNYYLTYIAQVIADGEFGAAPTVAQEMYNPETYGRFEATKMSILTKENTNKN